MNNELNPSQIFKQEQKAIESLFVESSKLPEKIAHYKVLSELGAGGMGKVYKALDEKINRFVAIKVILHPSADAKKRFIAEAKTMAKFQHSNIATVYDIATDAGVDYIAMDFIEGENLVARQLPVRQVLIIIRDAALALDYAHQQGVIHRDLKPANLMLCNKSNKVIVMDFGLAKNIKTADVTQSGTLIGTPRYMAPEQAASKLKEISPRTDVYALGVILYELLARVPAFEGKTPAQIIYNVLHREIEPLRKRKPQLAAELSIICNRAMAKEIHQRYASAKDLAKDIDRFLQGKIIQAQAFSLWYRMFKKVKKQKMIAKVITLFLLALVAGIYTFAKTEQKKALRHLQKADSMLLKLSQINTLIDAKKLVYDSKLAYKTLELHIAVLDPLRKAHGHEKANILLIQVHKRIGLLALAKKNYILSQSAFRNYKRLGGKENLLLLLKQEENKDVKRVKAIIAKLKRKSQLEDRELEAWEIEISRMRYPKVVQTLLPYVKSKYRWQRLVAIAVLGKLGDKSTKVQGKDSVDWLLEQLEQLNPVKDSKQKNLANKEIEKLIWALGWLKDIRAEELVSKKRWQAGHTSLLWRRTKTPYQWIPYTKKALGSAKTYSDRGFARQIKGDLDGAIADYNKALKLNPKFILVYNNRGLLRQKKGDLDGAIADYNQVIKLNPENNNAKSKDGQIKMDYEQIFNLHPQLATVYGNRANAKRAKGDLDGAMTDYDQALKIDPKYILAYNNRGLLKKQIGDIEGAIVDYNQALKIDPKDVIAYGHRGIAKKARGDMEGAIADYTHAIKLNPKDATIYNHRGIIRQSQGNLEGAMADYTQALKLNPKLINAYRNRANARKIKGDFKEAIADCNKALKLNPKSATIYSLRGSIKGAKRDFPGAIADCNKAIKLNPKLASAYGNIGTIKRVNGDFDGAIAAYNKALKLNPYFTDVYNYRGTIKQSKKDLEGAIIDYNKALKLNPNLVEAYNNRGLARQVKDDLEGAISDYNRALMLNPKNAKAYNYRGLAWQTKKDFNKAMSDYNKALKLNPKLATAYYNRASAKEKQKDLGGAIADYNRALKLAPKMVAAYYERGSVRGAQGDLNGAIADYNKAIRLNPKDADVYYRRGNAKSDQGNLKGAIVDYNKALKLNPKLACAYNHRGNTKKAKGDVDGAIVDYTKALRLNPKLVDAYNNRGFIRWTKGDLDGSIADCTKALELNPRLVDAYNNRGNARNDKGDLDGAIADYSKALKLNPNLMLVYNNRGNVKRIKGDLKGALADYNKAIKLNPKDADVYANRGHVKRIKSDLKGAVADYTTAIKISLKSGAVNPYNYLLLMGLKRLKRQPGQINILNRYAMQTNMSDFGWVLVKYYIGVISEKELATIAYRDPKHRRGHLCEFYYYVGINYLVQGNRRKAKSYFKKCLAYSVSGYIEPDFAKAELRQIAKNK